MPKTWSKKVPWGGKWRGKAFLETFKEFYSIKPKVHKVGMALLLRLYLLKCVSMCCVYVGRLRGEGWGEQGLQVQDRILMFLFWSNTIISLDLESHSPASFWFSWKDAELSQLCLWDRRVKLFSVWLELSLYHRGNWEWNADSIKISFETTRKNSLTSTKICNTKEYLKGDKRDLII